MSTPMRRQYLQIKKQYPDAILFFRLGDFYETFDDDAKIVAEVCEVALTSRPVSKGQRVPLAGVPWHSAETYIAKMVNAGYKVAICEQVGEVGKGLVDRDVVRVVTPGTLVEPGLLDERKNNYIAALIFEGGTPGGIGLCRHHHRRIRRHRNQRGGCGQDGCTKNWPGWPQPRS